MDIGKAMPECVEKYWMTDLGGLNEQVDNDMRDLCGRRTLVDEMQIK